MTSILIVDDAAFSRRMIRKYLQADGYKILEAANGKEGIELATSQTPNLILTDLLMPDMHGFELLKALKSANLNIPAIVISADIQETTQQQASALGAIQFINKPVKEQELRAAVQQAFCVQE